MVSSGHFAVKCKTVFKPSRAKNVDVFIAHLGLTKPIEEGITI